MFPQRLASTKPLARQRSRGLLHGVELQGFLNAAHERVWVTGSMLKDCFYDVSVAIHLEEAGACAASVEFSLFLALFAVKAFPINRLCSSVDAVLLRKALF